MVEPRFRSFLLDMLNWLDESPATVPEIRSHLQETLNAELQLHTPKKRTRAEVTAPPIIAGDIKISFGPLDSPPPESRIYNVTRIGDTSTRQYASHNGKHWSMLEVAGRHPDLFMDLLKPLAADLEAATTSESPLHVYVACDHGRHRSASCAWILHHLLKATGIPHDFDDSWEHSTHPHDRSDCQDCTGEIRSKLLDDVITRWTAAKKRRR